MAECTITIDRTGDFYVRVSEEDYRWLIKWVWSHYWSRSGKLYARRAHGPYRTIIYMHREILHKAIGPPPNNAPHGDHIDTDSTNNLRENLRWLSKADNNRNRYRYR